MNMAPALFRAFIDVANGPLDREETLEIFLNIRKRKLFIIRHEDMYPCN